MSIEIYLLNKELINMIFRTLMNCLRLCIEIDRFIRFFPGDKVNNHI